MILFGAVAVALAGEPTAPVTPPQVLVQPGMRYPALAADLPLPPVVCAAAVTLSADGRPTEVALPACPDLFARQAREDLAMWRFAPARLDGAPIPAVLTLNLRWQRDREREVAPPDLDQWLWTDDALARMGRQDFVFGAASVGLSMIGAALVVLAARDDVFETYRGRYLAAGGGLILFSVFGLNAAARFEGMSNRRRQRALWAAFHPEGAR